MYEFLDYQTHDVMTRNPITVTPETPLREVEDLFQKHDFNGLPVVDESGALIGILTKLDLLRAFRFTDEQLFPPYSEIMDRPAATVMTRDVRTVWPRTPLTRVLEKMIDAGSKSFPVIEGDRLVGMIAREDLIQGLLRADSGERPSGKWDGAEAESDDGS